METYQQRAHVAVPDAPTLRKNAQQTDSRRLLGLISSNVTHNVLSVHYLAMAQLEVESRTAGYEPAVMPFHYRAISRKGFDPFSAA